MISALWALLCRLVLILACGFVGYGLALVGQRHPMVIFLVLIGMTWRRFRRSYNSYAYGSARTASMGELVRRGWFGRNGPILGMSLADRPPKLKAVFGLINPSLPSPIACRTFLAAFFSSSWLEGRMLRVRDPVHLATVSPAGGGKSRRVAVPNLLANPYPSVVIDPKGELFMATAKHRRKKFKHTIIRLDPFNLCGPGGDTLNALDFINMSAPDGIDQCGDLANMLILRQGTEKEPHWNDRAENTLKAFLAFVCGLEPDRSRRNLGLVRQLLSNRNTYQRALDAMLSSDACDGTLRQTGGALTWSEGEEQASVQSTVMRHTDFLSSVPVIENVSRSSFDPLILRSGRGATVYLILPHDRLASLAALQRYWIGTIMRRITRGAPTEKNEVFWYLDEVAHIGHMQIIEDAVTLMRGMGMRLWFFVQSLDQFRTCYGEKAQTVLDNIGTQQYFAITSYHTAEEVSKRIGDQTIANCSINITKGDSQPTGGAGREGPHPGSRSTSRSETVTELGRRLLKPEEILVMPDHITLIFHKNMPCIVGRLLPDFTKMPEFRWGGTGRQGGLGILGGLAACLTLSLSFGFGVLAEMLPEQEVVRRALMVSAQRMSPPAPAAPPPPRPQARGYTQPYVPGLLPATRPTQKRRRASHRSQGGSGYLIQIR
jgi:type IV secretion system protein VirD4